MPESDETAAPAEGEATDAVDTPPRDELREALLADLQQRLGDAIVDSEIAGGDLWVRVRLDKWADAASACKDAGFTYFCFLSGIDWLPNPGLSGRGTWDVEGAPAEEDEGGTALETGVAGGATRFQVFARLYDVVRHVGVTLKADIDDSPTQPSIPSWTGVFQGADWHEREAWEMYGFDFAGHPGLRHLYLPQDFEGHPLRKDFPLLSREVKPWPGLVDKEPIPGEGEESDEGAEEPA